MPFFHVLLRVPRPTTIGVYTSRRPHGVTSLKILHCAASTHCTASLLMERRYRSWELSYRASRANLVITTLCVVAQYVLRN